MKPRDVVIVNCINPKEQVWGMLQSLDTAGVTIRGIDIRSFGDWMRQMKRPTDDQTLGLVTMFVPLFRVERIFLDERVGAVSSYQENFLEVVGQSVDEFLDPAPASHDDRAN